jgi:hypothetical protein
MEKDKVSSFGFDGEDEDDRAERAINLFKGLGMWDDDEFEDDDDDIDWEEYEDDDDEIEDDDE